MSKLDKYVFGEAGVSNLLLGVILICGALSLMLYMWAALSGIVSGEFDIVGETEGISNFYLAMLLLVVLSIVGGYEIGRYVQTEFTKRRKSK